MWFLNAIRSNIFLDGKAPTSKKLNQYKNAFEFQNVFAMLCNEALQRYDIDGLPDTVSKRVVLESLLWYGSVVFFKKAGAVWALPGLPTADYTLNGNPTKAIVHGRNGYTEEYKLYIPQGDKSFGRETTTGQTVAEEGEAVWVRENYLVYPFINYVIEFADKIADTYRTLDVTRANIKKPYIITAEESIIESVKAFFNKRDNNEEYIISSGVFPADKISLLGFDLNPDNVRDCTGLIDFYFSKFRELESVSAAPATIDKKAEITIPELNQNQGAEAITRLAVQNILTPELDFANECLGTHMTFQSNTEQQEMQPFEKGDEENDFGDKSEKNV